MQPRRGLDQVNDSSCQRLDEIIQRSLCVAAKVHGILSSRCRDPGTHQRSPLVRERASIIKCDHVSCNSDTQIVSGNLTHIDQQQVAKSTIASYLAALYGID